MHYNAFSKYCKTFTSPTFTEMYAISATMTYNVPTKFEFSQMQRFGVIEYFHMHAHVHAHISIKIAKMNSERLKRLNYAKIS